MRLFKQIGRGGEDGTPVKVAIYQRPRGADRLEFIIVHAEDVVRSVPDALPALIGDATTIKEFELPLFAVVAFAEVPNRPA